MRRPELGRLAPQAAFAAILVVCALLPFARERAADAVPTAAPEWPLAWDGQPLRPLALSPVEQRFAAHFPGHIARLTDGTRTLVLRAVHRATRQLHPAADCYRGLGYTLRDVRLE